MSADLIERIIGDILAGGARATEAAPFPRPNYQRDMSRRESSRPEAHGDFVDRVVAKALEGVPTSALLDFPKAHGVGPLEDAVLEAFPPTGGVDKPLVETVSFASGFVVPDCPRALLDYLGMRSQDRAIGFLHAKKSTTLLLLAADTVFDSATSPAVFPRFGQGDKNEGVTLVFGTQGGQEATSLVQKCLRAVEERQDEVLSGEFGVIEAVYADPIGPLLHRIHKAPLGSICGVVGGYPFPLGLLAASAALGQSGVSSEGFTSLGGGLHAVVTGTPGAIKEALRAARDRGAPFVDAGGRV